MTGILPTIAVTTLVSPMQPPAPATTQVPKPISNDPRIDPLLDNADFRFNKGSPVGTAVTVTYSFPSQMPTGYTGEDAAEWAAFSAEQQTATRAVFKLLQEQINITFTEVADSPTDFGVMRFSNNRQATSSGYALMPNSTGNDKDADTWIALGYDKGMDIGGYNWMTLVHEIGHAIGLNHPGNYNAGEAANKDAVGNYLSVNEDAYFNSVMSYRHSAQGIQDTWFMPYDMLALRYVYGTKAFATGDTRYTYQDSSGTSANNIIDDGGVDTLDFSALTTPVVVNMVPGAFSSVGKLANGNAAKANLTTSFDAVIENVIGTAGDDLIQGNQANNTLTLGAGNDGADGGAGIDTVVLHSPKSAFALVKTADGYTLRDNVGTDGLDTLIGIERLTFSDGAKLALDLGGNAGQVARLLDVALGKAAVGNPAYVAAGLGALDGGMGFEALSAALMNILGKTTAADALSLMWTNLLGSAPDAAQVSAVLTSLGNPNVGALTALVANLDLTAQHVGLVGLADTGLAFG